MILHRSDPTEQIPRDAAHERDAFLEQLLERGAILSIVRRDGRAIPLVDGERITSPISGRVAAVQVRCPWCRDGMHQHSPGDGHVLSHCDARAEINTGYIIRERAISAEELAAADSSSGAGVRTA